MSDHELLPCPFCGGDAEVSYGADDYDYDGGDRWRFYRAKVMCRCGSELKVENDSDEYLPLERALDFAAEAWNTRAERTCEDAGTRFNAWVCSECKATLLLMFDDYDEPSYSVDGVADVPRYCPNCGAKVVER